MVASHKAMIAKEYFLKEKKLTENKIEAISQ